MGRHQNSPCVIYFHVIFHPLFLKLYFSMKNLTIPLPSPLCVIIFILLLLQYIFLPEPVGPKSRMLLLSNWIFSTSESSMSLPACSRNCVGEWTPLAPRGELRFDVCVISICNSTRQWSKVSATRNSFHMEEYNKKNWQYSRMTKMCQQVVFFHMYEFFSLSLNSSFV